MECVGKAIEGEVSKGIIAVSQSFESKTHEGAKVETTLPRGHIEGKSSAILSQGLTLGKDNRRLGVWAEIEQPPWAKNEQKMELDTDSITT